MANPLPADELREIIGPLLLGGIPIPEGGQPRVPDRNARTGNPFILKTGSTWDDLPYEMSRGCARTRGRWPCDWQTDCIGKGIQEVWLDRPRGAGRIDWPRTLVDSSSGRAAYIREATGPTQVHRDSPGGEYHHLSGTDGIPRATSVRKPNADDISRPVALFRVITPVAVVSAEER